MSVSLKVKKIELSTSITALKCIQPGSILIGLGGEVRLLQCKEKPSWNKTAHCQVFSYQSIHGLVSSDYALDRFLVFGGRQYALIQLSDLDQPHIEVLWSKYSEDWILDCSWLRHDAIALMLAHGKLVEVSAFTGIIARSAVCLDRSILYSARIVSGENWNDILLLSGTVHNQIILWSPGKSPDQPAKTIAILSGHKGVIFSVRFDKASQRICSTSDDRTARIWKRKSVGTSEYAEIAKTEQETWQLELTVFGNKARVWDSAFLPHSLLATIAEDGGVMVWNERGECLMQCWVEGGLLCLDMLPQSTPDAKDGSGLVLCAGATSGSLYLFPVNLLSQLPLCLPIVEGNPKQVFLTKESGILCFTSVGKLFLHQNKEGWSDCFASKSPASYCLMALSPSKSRLATGNIEGHLHFFSVEGSELRLMAEVPPSDNVIEGRVFSLHWLTEDLLLACGPAGSLRLLSLELSSLGGYHIRIKGSYELPPCKERWTTCASLVSSSHLICGDRVGSIHLYSLTSLQVKPVWSSTRLHGGKGVSCIVECTRHEGRVEEDLDLSTDSTKDIMSCGRDGTLRKLRLLPGSDILQVLLSIRLPMDWASHLISSPDFGLLIVGFHSLYFCVWSLREERHLLKIMCWGGHRSWDLHLGVDPDLGCTSLALTFIKDKSIYYFNAPLEHLALPAPLRGLHNKSVNSCSWVRDWNLLVSGGEDTMVRVSNDTTLSPLCCVESHISSVRAVISCVVSAQPDTVLVITAGGRAQLKIWTLSPSGELYERGSQMLRSESQLRIDWRKQGGAPLDQPDVRYMDLALLPCSDSTNYLYAASSDGILRVFKVDLCQMSLELMVAKSTRENRCLLKIVAIFASETQDKSQATSLCFTASTDGFITVYKHILLLEEVVEVGRWKSHCGGVNALSVAKYSGSSSYLLVASGGDDAVIVLSVYSLASDLTLTLSSSLRLDFLHTCQITGIEIVGGEYVVSVGLDGRLCLTQWTITSSNDQHKITAKHLSSYSSSLYDIHGVQTTLQENELSVCIYGLGLEVVNIPLAPG